MSHDPLLKALWTNPPSGLSFYELERWIRRLFAGAEISLDDPVQAGHFVLLRVWFPDGGMRVYELELTGDEESGYSIVDAVRIGGNK